MNYRKLFAAIVLTSAPAFGQYVFSDGTNVLSSVREMPTQGVDRRTGKVVVGLYGADAETRAACGWYLVASTNVGKIEGSCRCVSNRWEFSSSTATRFLYWEPFFKNWEISKFKLLSIAIGFGKLRELNALIDANPTNRLLWEAAVTLDRTNALVTSAEPAAAEALGVGRETISNILWEARAK